MLSQLSHEDRLQLMRFVCSFAWADLEVSEEERDFVSDLVKRLDFDSDTAARVSSWLTLPPDPEDVDPTTIPVEHRQIFLDTLLGLVGSDGVLTEAETETFNLLSQLVR